MTQTNNFNLYPLLPLTDLYHGQFISIGYIVFDIFVRMYSSVTYKIPIITVVVVDFWYFLLNSEFYSHFCQCTAFNNEQNAFAQ